MDQPSLGIITIIKQAVICEVGDRDLIGHPTPAGSYLAACVLFKTIFERSPVGLPYAPRGVDAAARDHLQRIATLTTR